MDAILNFFNPKAPQQQTKKQQVIVQQQQSTKKQEPPQENSMLDFFRSKPTKQQQIVVPKKQQGLLDFLTPKQQQKVMLQQKKQGLLDFLTPKQQQTKKQQVIVQQKQQQMPPLKERSHIFEPIQQFQVADQLANQVIDQASKDIVKHVQKQAQQSSQQLANLKKKEQEEKKVEQARKAHQQILEYSQKIRSLLAEIQEAYQMGRIQTQQTNNRMKKKEKEAMYIISELRSVLEQINTTRQQTRKVQQSHIRQLQQLKQKLVVPQEQKLNRKVVQHVTPDGNKMRIQVNVHPDSKCCVANSLSQQARTYVHLPPVTFT